MYPSDLQIKYIDSAITVPDLGKKLVKNRQSI
jgi:hypothetical protein